MSTTQEVKQTQELVRMQLHTKEHKLSTCLRVAKGATKQNQDPNLAVYELCTLLGWDYTELLPHVVKEVAQ
jgi:hypothetical protein